jgi:hypothetical protein
VVQSANPCGEFAGVPQKNGGVGARLWQSTEAERLVILLQHYSRAIANFNIGNTSMDIGPLTYPLDANGNDF